ncbi:MAG TPA: transposase domain-containing protein [Pseudonocardiaceae bacterium]
MVEAGVVRPDQVSLGVLVSAVPRDAVDAAVAAFGVGVKRSDGKLPAHVTAYLMMALCLFADDDYAPLRPPTSTPTGSPHPSSAHRPPYRHRYRGLPP